MFNGSTTLKTMTSYALKLVQSLVPQDDVVINSTTATHNDKPPRSVSRAATNGKIALPYTSAVSFVQDMSQLIFNPHSIDDEAFQAERGKVAVEATLQDLRSGLKNKLNSSMLARDPGHCESDILAFYVGAYKDMVANADSGGYPSIVRDQMHKITTAIGIAPESLLHNQVQVKTSLFDFSGTDTHWRDNYPALVQNTLKPAKPVEVPSALQYIFDNR